MVHIARVTPPSLASDALSSFDEEVKQCFAMCLAINVTNDAWSMLMDNIYRATCQAYQHLTCLMLLQI